MPHRLFTLIFIVIMPCIAWSQCHHAGGHMHAASHAHVHVASHYHSHIHYHCYSSHSYRRYGGRADYGSSLNIPLKGAHDFAAGSGLLSGWQVADKSVTGATPGFFAGYRYYFSGGAAIGISAGTQVTWGNDTCHCTPAGGTGNTINQYGFRVTSLTLTAEFSWLLYSRRSFQVYQGIAAGVSSYIENDTYPDKTTATVSGYKFNGQVTVAGIRYGRALGGFAELGYGHKGIISGGLSYQAGRRKARG